MLRFSKACGIAVLLAAITLTVATPSIARSPVRKYSPTLRGEFYIDRFYFPGYGWHTAVGVIDLDEDSPLHAAGVKRFDVITRLDNIRVTNLERLEKHYCWTSVRYYRDKNRTSFTRRFHISDSSCNHR